MSSLLAGRGSSPLAAVPKEAKLFARLGTGDREWVILPGADHAAHLEDSRVRLVRSVADFVERNRRE